MESGMMGYVSPKTINRVPREVRERAREPVAHQQHRRAQQDEVGHVAREVELPPLLEVRGGAVDVRRQAPYS